MEMTIEQWMETYPNRVWFQTEKGWASKKPSLEDIERRLAFANRVTHHYFYK